MRTSKLTMITGLASLAAGLVILVAFTVVSRSDDGAATDRAKLMAEYRRPAEIPFPASDPYSEAKAHLGRMLFFDPVLSGPRTQACASYHNPALSWQDGHFRNLESVAFGPITNPNIMNMPEKELVARLSAIPGYVTAFDAAFGSSGISKHNIELALATFERSIVAGDAPFDRWIAGDHNAISAAAKRGFDLFNGKAHCSACHSGWSFTDSSFHDVGVATGKDIGRGRLFPTSQSLRYAFKTPTLRDVDRRAPYMHDGSVKSLEQVIDLYNKGGIDRPSRAEDIRPLGLTAQDKADLIAFLHTLTGTSGTVALTTLPR